MATLAVNKGCYVGQEIVARLRARGQVNHLLVGLELSEEPLPEVDAELSFDGKKTGELTSIVHSPALGAIALGYVRRDHSEPGTTVDVALTSAEGALSTAQVRALPFVAPTTPTTPTTPSTPSTETP